MENQICLTGITWDHPRGYESIRAVSEEFCRLHTQVTIRWDVRSLKEFGDYPVTELANRYDLIMLDHPHLGSAVEESALAPLDQYLDREFLLDQERNSVGKSYESYASGGRQWALAVDAAAQVSAYRPDLLQNMGQKVPGTWDEVLSMADRIKGKGMIGIPLCPTDCYCSFLTLCANRYGDDFFDEERGIARETAVGGLEMLQALLHISHPESLSMNPIQMLDRMGETDEILYVPLLFGYSNYAREKREKKHLVRFHDIPTAGGGPSGALLGGVGLAISSQCQAPETAAEFVRYAACGEVQKSVYYEHAGQPGYLGAWEDEAVNRDCHGFFKDTLRTLQNSYLRPRYRGYNRFQEQAGAVIHRGLKAGTRPQVLAEELERLFASLKAGEGHG